MYPVPLLDHTPEISALQVVVVGAVVLLEFNNSIWGVVSDSHLK